MNSCPPSDDGSYTVCKVQTDPVALCITLGQAVGRNPYGGVVSFDNIFMSWLAVFISITVDTWSQIQYVMMETHSVFVW